jgi:hypothetical protein
MFWWLIGVAACLLIWGSIWKSNFSLAFGITFGVLLAIVLSFFVRPYVIDMTSIPVWLPPLPLATIAIALFIYGALVWIRGNDALPKKNPDDSADHH